MPHRKPVAVLFMTAAGVVGRVGALASNIVVGIFLTQQEIGTYAVAVGILGFTAMLRAGGSAHYLPTIRSEDYDREAGRMFWWGLVFLLLGAVVTWATAAAIPLFPKLDAPPRLDMALYLLGGRQVVMAFQQIGRMRLAARLEFQQLATLDIANAIVRLVLTSVLAWRGAGALALVIPYAFSPVVELAYYVARGDMSRVSYRWTGATVAETARQMAWPLLIAALVSLNTQVNFLLVKLVVPLATVGVFYFAYQLAMQPVTMLSSALTSVFSAHFARERGDSRHEARAMRDAFTGTMLFVPIVMFGVVATFASAQRLIWDGKWDAATAPVILLACGASWSTALTLLTGPLAGLRQFRPIAGFEALKAVGVLGGAALGSLVVWVVEPLGDAVPEWMRDGATVIAAATALVVTVVSVAQMLWLMPRYGMTRIEAARIVFHGPLLAATIALASNSLGGSLARSIGVPGGRQSSAIEFATTAVVYGCTSLVAIRFMAESSLVAALEAVPPRVRGIVTRALGL
jgi:O-antigen/teichoic acid export membrane protein